MNRTGRLSRKKPQKIGRAVTGISVVIPTKNGKEESGVIVYKRKAEYEEDPYKKGIRA